MILVDLFYVARDQRSVQSQANDLSPQTARVLHNRAGEPTLWKVGITRYCKRSDSPSPLSELTSCSTAIFSLMLLSNESSSSAPAAVRITSKISQIRLLCNLLIGNRTFYSVSQKNPPPLKFSDIFFPNGWEFLV